ncbi:MAG: selenocysteine-specific translation elongation factor [Calditrichaeota bacterium]|nr:selenocysteine-specific translation elongation factor [Calditrichota bacterium]
MAGHIDHGKTVLVKALTGIDTDRLKEEKKRGITIDLGFAHLTQNSTIIDVPGHEKLIKNMVAGVTTIDLVLFVIAADDGIMPQTREHLDILNLLGISRGIFVITKIDLVDDEWGDLVEEEVRNLIKNTGMSGAPVIRVSGVTGEGIEELRGTILEMMSGIAVRSDDGIFRLPIDRVFVKAGFGSIVTGSVISGTLEIGQTVEILPEKLRSRVRGLQSHDTDVEKVAAGYRAAINLTGLDKNQLQRGQVVTLPGYYEAVNLFYARISVLPESPVVLKNRMRIRVHLHTTEVIGRIVFLDRRELSAGETDFAQVWLDNSVYASFRDRFIIRQFSPQNTLGGGIVLETNPPRFRKKNSDAVIDSLKGLESDSQKDRILSAFSLVDLHALSEKTLQIKTGLSIEILKNQLDELSTQNLIVSFSVGQEKFYYSRQQLDKVKQVIRKELKKYHQLYPGRKGMPVPEILSNLEKYFSQDVVTHAISSGMKTGQFQITEDAAALPDFKVQFSRKDETVLIRIEEILLEDRFQPPLFGDLAASLGIPEKELREYLGILKKDKKIVSVEEKMFFHSDAIRDVVSLIKEYFRDHEEMRIADFRSMLGTTRKYAVPLLVYLDNQNFTRREGDIRKAGSSLIHQ